MEIRYISQSDDLLEISSIYEKSWKYAYKGIIPQDYLDSIPTGRWADGINKDGRNNLIITENGQMIGTACFCKSRWERFSDYGEIVSIYLLPDHMGKGYGKALLNGCIDELHNNGFDKILLWVLKDNDRARKFYERNGFVCSEEYQCDSIGGKEVAEVMYYLCR